MRRLWLITALCLAPVIAAPQEEGGRIERLVERTLSGTGRTVELTGFQGALSSEARFERMTIADNQGIWLTIDNAVLDWNFAALARGTLEVAELSARRIDLDRAPMAADNDLPASQSSGFRIPDLPVALQLDALNVPEIRLGPTLLGEEMTLRLTASAALQSGAADIDVTALRINGAGGQMRIAASYDPGDEALAIDAVLSEPAEGLVARLLGIPGAPDLALRIAGTGPLDDYRADMSLATEGSDRLIGTVTITADGGDRAFSADFDGDIRPLLATGQRGFFGPRTTGTLRGGVGSEGALEIAALTLSTAHMTLDGTAAIASGGQPQRFDLSLQLLNPVGRVRLPGSDVTLANGDLRLSFDASQGDDLRLAMSAQGIGGAGWALAELDLQTDGPLTPGAEVIFDGQLALKGTGVTLDDTALSAAIGPDVNLTTSLVAEAGGAVALTGLTAQTAHAMLAGALSATPADGRMAITADAALTAPDLGAFGPLVVPLSAGSAALNLAVSAELPGGALAARVRGTTRGLDIGQPRLAALLAPESTLSFTFRRDENGSRLEDLRLENPELTAQGLVELAPERLDAQLALRLRDLGLIEPGLPGPVTLEFDAGGTPETRAISGTFVLNATSASLAGDLASRAIGGDETELEINARVDAPDLARFAAIAGPLRAGALRADLAANTRLPGGRTEAQLIGLTRALDLGIPRLAPLLTPETQITANVTRDADQISLDRLTLQNPELTAEGQGALAGDDITWSLTARLAEMARLEPRLSGPAVVTTTGNGALVPLNLDMTYAATLPFAGLNGRADLRRDRSGAPTQISFAADLAATDLGGLSAIAAPLRGGAANARLSGTAALPGPDLALTLDGTTRRIDMGVPLLAPILAPETRITATAGIDDGVLSLNNLNLTSNALTAEASASFGQNSRASLSARLTDLGRIVAALPGAVTLQAEATSLTDQPQITASLASASGINAQAAGRVALPGGAVDLTTTGTLPLSLAQPFLGERVLTGQASFDLALSGPPGLDALRGRISTTDARLADPALDITLAPLQAEIGLAAGRADIAARGALNDAPIEASGIAALTAPFDTDVSLQLGNVPLRYLDVVRTRFGGALTLRGPAARELAIGGALTLSDTEIRVPDTGLGGAGPVPDIAHIGASVPVRQTLSRAGLPRRDAQSSDGGYSLPLDLTVSTASPVFVRGRGLDAEFAGSLQLQGTVSDPRPVGAFELRRGRLALLGQRLDISEGEIALEGALIPRLRVLAEAQAEDITAQITLSGPADQPELTLSSIPDLPQDEILAVLFFGKSAANLSPLQVARLISSIATLTGSGGGGLLDQTRSQLGFDDFDLRTDAETGEAELAIGRYINENVYSEVELGAGGNAQVNLNLDLTDNTTVRGSVGSDGQTGVGIFWQRDY